jgi:hypothetical protein
MLKKIYNLVLVLAVFSLPSMGHSSVAGNWSVKGTIVEKVKITGYGERSVKVRGRDVFTFYNDRSFVSLDGIHGRWVQNGSNFRVSLNKSDLESLFYSMASDYGLNVVSFRVPKAYITGKLSSRITGTMVMEMKGAVYGFNGNILNLYSKATMSFSGKRFAYSANLSSTSQSEPKLTDLIRIMLRSFIEEAEVSR